MSKRPSLAESMKAAAIGGTTTTTLATVLPPPLPPAVSPPVQAASALPSSDRPPGYYAATRAGKKKVTATLDPAAHKQLKTLAVELEMTTEALLLEAIADLFAKHGRAGR